MLLNNGKVGKSLVDRGAKQRDGIVMRPYRKFLPGFTTLKENKSNRNEGGMIVFMYMYLFLQAFNNDYLYVHLWSFRRKSCLPSISVGSHVLLSSVSECMHAYRD